MYLRTLSSSFGLVVATMIVATASAGGYGMGGDSKPMQEPEPVAEPACQSIAAIACGNDDFSTLCAAVQLAGLAETLDQGGPFTVFAPNNEAFDALPEGTLDALLDDIPALTNVLTFHVVDGKVEAADVECDARIEMLNGGISRVKCLDDGRLFIEGDGNAISVDGVGPEIIATDIQACNGVIHVVGDVILP